MQKAHFTKRREDWNAALSKEAGQQVSMKKEWLL